MSLPLHEEGIQVFNGLPHVPNGSKSSRGSNSCIVMVILGELELPKGFQHHHGSLIGTKITLDDVVVSSSKDKLLDPKLMFGSKVLPIVPDELTCMGWIRYGTTWTPNIVKDRAQLVLMFGPEGPKVVDALVEDGNPERAVDQMGVNISHIPKVGGHCVACSSHD